MKHLIMLVLALCLIGWAIPVNGAEYYGTTPSKLWVDIPAGSGSATFKIFISNGSSVDRTFQISHWYNYMNPIGDYRSIPEEWITQFSPNGFMLPPGGEGIVNVTVEVPVDTPADRYITWIKVRDDPVSEERPIVVVIRTGTAVPKYEYSMSPSFYQLEAVFSGETRSSDPMHLEIKNTAAAPCGYGLYVPHKFTINGEKWRDGNFYTPLYELECADTVEEMSEIVVVAQPQIRNNTIYSLDTKNIAAYSKGTLPFTLVIPSEIPEGYYEARVGVRITDGDLQGTTIGIQYECRLMIHVIHREGRGDTPWWAWWPLMAVGGVFCVGIVGMVVLERRKKHS